MLGRHPWIWIALAYLSFLGVMFTFVWIAQTHADPVVPIAHPNDFPGTPSGAAGGGAGATQPQRSSALAPVSSAAAQAASELKEPE
jgi:hypothetical protein